MIGRKTTQLVQYLASGLAVYTITNWYTLKEQRPEVVILKVELSALR